MFHSLSVRLYLLQWQRPAHRDALRAIHVAESFVDCSHVGVIALRPGVDLADPMPGSEMEGQPLEYGGETPRRHLRATAVKACSERSGRSESYSSPAHPTISSPSSARNIASGHDSHSRSHSSRFTHHWKVRGHVCYRLQGEGVVGPCPEFRPLSDRDHSNAVRHRGLGLLADRSRLLDLAVDLPEPEAFRELERSGVVHDRAGLGKSATHCMVRERTEEGCPDAAPTHRREDARMQAGVVELERPLSPDPASSSSSSANSRASRRPPSPASPRPTAPAR